MDRVQCGPSRGGPEIADRASEPLIRFSGAALAYGARTVLEGVDCEVLPGDFAALVGPNGSGKTTFLRAALGLLAPAKGRIRVERARRFAYVPQIEALNLAWPMTVREAAELALRSRRAFGGLGAEDRRAVDEALERAEIAGLGGRSLRELSGGQRQRAVLAQALAQRPEVLLLDEPTQGLDIVAEARFLRLVEGLRAERGTTVLFVTHALHLALNHAEKVLLFHKGRVVQATPEELARTGRLEEIYGVPFAHGSAEGARWVLPRLEGGGR